MKTNTTNTTTTFTTLAAAAAALGFAILSGGCPYGEPTDGEEIAGVESKGDIAPLAVFDGSAGMQFASEEIAREWRQQAPGVWLHQDGTRLIAGADGHRFAAAELENELDALVAGDADDDLVAAKQVQLDRQRDALASAQAATGTKVTCSIGLYTGPSGAMFGVIGGAAIAELSCQGGTVVFTVDTVVCTSTTGCGTSSHTAIPDSIPRLWGQLRSGYGSCYSDVFVTPAYVGQSASYACN